MFNSQSSIVNSQYEPALGELPLSDQLYNALHGVGDIDRLHKIAVVTVMHDYYYPAQPLVHSQRQANPAYAAGRDEIIHIVLGCLASIPERSGQILGRWVEEAKAEMQERVVDAIRAESD